MFGFTFVVVTVLQLLLYSHIVLSVFIFMTVADYVQYSIFLCTWLMLQSLNFLYQVSATVIHPDRVTHTVNFLIHRNSSWFVGLIKILNSLKRPVFTKKCEFIYFSRMVNSYQWTKWCFKIHCICILYYIKHSDSLYMPMDGFKKKKILSKSYKSFIWYFWHV